jgi:hypothetical protein
MVECLLLLLQNLFMPKHHQSRSLVPQRKASTNLENFCQVVLVDHRPFFAFSASHRRSHSFPLRSNHPQLVYHRGQLATTCATMGRQPAGHLDPQLLELILQLFFVWSERLSPAGSECMKPRNESQEPCGELHLGMRGARKTGRCGKVGLGGELVEFGRKFLATMVGLTR